MSVQTDYYIPQMRIKDETISACATEISRLRKGIQDYLDGDYGRDVHFKTKHDKCPHGLFEWEACENCIDAHFARLMDPAGPLA